MLIAQDLILSCLICWSHRTSCSPHMLIAQDSAWFTSYADRTGLSLILPRMLIAQDFMFASYANCTGLDLVFPHMLIAQDFMFASYANCIGLDFIFHHFFLLTWTYLWVPVWLRFEVLWRFLIQWNLSSFSPKVFLKLLSGVRLFFILHSYFR